MKTGDDAQTYPFAIKMNPNLKGVTEADLEEQFDLATKIMKKTSVANEAVIKIPEIRSHLDSLKTDIPASDFDKIIQPFLDKTAAVEEALYQVKKPG